MILTNSDAALSAAILAARAGREVLLHYFGRLSGVEEKHQAGLVSVADRESERAVFEILRKKFPSDEYLGEESAFQNQANKAYPTQAAKGSRWIVDPLDGTTNYVHGLPIFAISIGLEIAGQIEVGVIDIPILGETYTAIRGKGAWVNGVRLQVSKTKELKKSLLATGFNADNEELLQSQLQVFSKIVRSCRGIRRAGAAAYDLTQVARGTFDLYWETGLQAWDSAAGILLVREAGGEVHTLDRKIFNPYCNTLVASNGLVYEEFFASYERKI
jgi:myo-inositol-1(or 4)-monophosphatase